MRRSVASLVLSIVLSAALPPGVARAAPGDGIRLGDWVIHPSVESELGYQTNVRLLYDPGLVQNPDDWELRVVPKITAERTGAHSKINFSALYDWRRYAYNSDLDAWNNFEIGASSTFHDDHPLGLSAEERFRIQTNPNELQSFGNYQQTSNTARISTIYKPGEALDVRPSVFWLYDNFQYIGGTNGNTDLAERDTTGAAVDARWAFLSRTVFDVAAEGGAITYTQSISLTPPPPAPPLAQPVNSGAWYWKAEAGIVGQVTPKLNAALKGGYGQDHYSRNESLDDSRGFTATAKLEWTPRVTQVISGGYERSFEDVFFTNFAIIDRLFFKYRHLLQGVWLFSFDSAGEWQDYSTPFNRNDFVLKIEPAIRRRVREFADIGFDYSYEHRWSTASPAQSAGTFDPPSGYLTQRFMLTAMLQW